MKVLKFSVSCILLFALFAGVHAVDVVLQNDAEYTVCEDAYTSSQSSTSNYGDKETLNMLYELCSS